MGLQPSHIKADANAQDPSSLAAFSSTFRIPREELQMLVGTTPHPFHANRFWDALFAFPEIILQADGDLLVKFASSLARVFVENNASTHNLATFSLHISHRIDTLLNSNSSSDIQQIYVSSVNSLFFFRIFLQHLISLVHPYDLQLHFPLMSVKVPNDLPISFAEATEPSSRDITVTPTVVPRHVSDHPGASSSNITSASDSTHDPPELSSQDECRNILVDPIFEIVRTLVNYCTATVITRPETYHLQTEVVSTLIVMASTQMYQPMTAAAKDVFLSNMLKHPRCEYLIPSLVKLYIQKTDAPVSDEGFFQQLAHLTRLLGLLFYLPFQLFSFWKPKEDHSLDNAGELGFMPFSTKKSYNLEDRCGLLAIILTHQHISNEEENPFLSSISKLADDYGNVNESPVDLISHKSVSYSLLYDAISSRLHDDLTVLILYNLLYRNSDFQTYVLSRTDVDTLVIPILRLLHITRDTQPNRVYMLLVILLILSQDSTFNTTLFTTIIPNTPWITEQIMTNASIGSLVVVVLVRVVQENLKKKKDLYLHSNCLAILANMSSSFQSIHPYASQRLLYLFDTLRKKYTRIASKISKSAPTDHQDFFGHGNDQSYGTESGYDIAQTDSTTESLSEELAICSDLLSLVLGTINNIIFSALPRNPCLVYSLMHQREMFSSFRTHPKFLEYIENVESVLSFFGRKLEQAITPQKLSVDDILEVITNSSKTWTSDRLRVIPVLQYQYNEEEPSHEFFVPYIWTIVRSCFDTAWIIDKIILNTTEAYEAENETGSIQSDPDFVTVDLQKPSSPKRSV